MSWGTYYKHNEYLNRIGKNQVDIEIENCNVSLDRVFMELLAYMAATPPSVQKEDDYEWPYPEFLVQKLKEMREEIEEKVSLRTRLYQCQEVLKEHPEDVEEG